MLTVNVKKELKKLGYNEQDIKVFDRKQMREQRKDFKEAVKFLAKRYIKK